MDPKNAEGPVENNQNPSGYDVTGDSGEAPVAPSTGPVVTKIEQPTKTSSKVVKRWLWAAAFLAVLVILSGGYAFGFYLPNQPGNVYKNSLKNTAAGIDKITSYLQSQKTSGYRSMTYTGSLKFASPALSFDGNLSGKFDRSGNGDLRLNADIMGKNLILDLRSIKADGSTSPDIYLKATGIKQMFDSQGLGGFGSLDEQWLVVDHTIVDTLKNAARHSLGSGDRGVSAPVLPTLDQVNNAISAVNKVNKQYLFTAGSSTAVLANEKFVAKETKDGRSVDHFRVGYDKANLKAYVAALKSALDSSKLNDWSKKTNQGKNLSEVIGIKPLEDSINDARAGYTFDLWADNRTKLIHAITFTDVKDRGQEVTITQNYTGGSKYPFSISAVTKDGKGVESTGMATFTIDTEANRYTLSVSGTAGNGTSGSLNLSLTPSASGVTEVAPAGAKPLSDLMNQFSPGNLFSTGGSDRTGI